MSIRPPRTHVTIQNLCKEFGGITLYKDFNFEIPYGKIVSIFGPNGCGKSTLINMISISQLVLSHIICICSYCNSIYLFSITISSSTNACQIFCFKRT